MENLSSDNDEKTFLLAKKIPCGRFISLTTVQVEIATDVCPKHPWNKKLIIFCGLLSQTERAFYFARDVQVEIATDVCTCVHCS